MELADQREVQYWHLNKIFWSYLATSLNIKEVESVRAGGSKGLKDFLGAIVPDKVSISFTLRPNETSFFSFNISAYNFT